MGDYLDWSNFVRGAVIWVGEQRWLAVSDPANSTDSSYKQDEETQDLAALLSAWKLSFGINEGVTASVAVKHANNAAGGDLYEAIKAVAEKQNSLNSTKLGHWLRNHKGRFVDKLRFVQAGISHSATCWKVESVLRVAAGEDGEDGEDVSNPPRGNAKDKECILRKRAGTILPILPSSPVSDDIEAQEERSAIMEFDGGLSRPEAERLSREVAEAIRERDR